MQTSLDGNTGARSDVPLSAPNMAIALMVVNLKSAA